MFWYARGIHEVVSVYGELCDFIYLCYYVIDEMPAGEQKLQELYSCVIIELSSYFQDSGTASAQALDMLVTVVSSNW